MTITAPAADAPWLIDGAEVVRSHGTDAASGLRASEAARRASQFGPNRLDAVSEPSAWRQFLSHFTDPLVYLLLAAVAASIAAWALEGAGIVDGSSDLTEARTAGFTVLVLAQLFNCLNSRAERTSAFFGLFTNRRLWLAIIGSLALQVAVLYVPMLNRAFETTPLTAADWALCAVMASSVLWMSELKKLVSRAA